MIKGTTLKRGTFLTLEVSFRLDSDGVYIHPGDGWTYCELERNGKRVNSASDGTELSVLKRFYIGWKAYLDPAHFNLWRRGPQPVWRPQPVTCIITKSNSKDDKHMSGQDCINKYIYIF